MSETITLRSTGTREELEGFLRSLAYSPELALISHAWANHSEPDAAEPRFGQTELVDLVLHFGVALGAHATYELVVNAFNAYRGSRTHMKIQSSASEQEDDAEPDLDNPPDEAGTSNP